VGRSTLHRPGLGQIGAPQRASSGTAPTERPQSPQVIGEVGLGATDHSLRGGCRVHGEPAPEGLTPLLTWSTSRLIEESRVLVVLAVRWSRVAGFCLSGLRPPSGTVRP
jgi:hypothetical protein